MNRVTTGPRFFDPGALASLLHPRELRPFRPRDHLRYRPDIDGMRAIAVLPVMLFHGGVSLFSGGYVGVDIFFVISGFLIGRIILTEVGEGRFSILSFYDRRIRRIIPPLLLVIAATLAASWFLLPPRQFEGLGFEALATMAFASNLWFWRQTGYFHPESETEPLLHTWSLGIEEQFYLFFPAIVLLVGRRLILPVIVAILLASLALSCVAVFSYPSATFFLLPMRAWELMIGCLVASGRLPLPRSRTVANLAVAAGLLLMLAPIFAYGRTTHFPGASALVPTIGAALAIWGGQVECGASSLLSARPLVVVGLLSYSLYLWHWPIFALLHYASASIALNPAQLVFALVLTFVFAALSVRFVEGPLRDRGGWPARRLYPVLGCMAALVVVAGLLIARTHGFPARFSAAAIRLGNAADDFDTRMKSCIDMPVAKLAAHCHLGSPGAPSFALWGDSHAAAIASSIDVIATQKHRSGILITGSGCFPLEGYVMPGMTPIDARRCIRRSADALAIIMGNPAIRTVIIESRWRRANRDPDAALTSRLEGMFERLRRSGKTVVVIGGMPAPRANIPWSLSTAAHMRINPAGLVERADASPFYNRLAALDRAGRIRFIDVAPALCAGSRCPAAQRGRAMFTDDNHISDFAARTFVMPYLIGKGVLP